MDKAFFFSWVNMHLLFEIYFWHIWKCQKIETKMFCVYLHVPCAHKVASGKIDYFCGLRKNKKWYQNKLFCDFFLSFLHRSEKISVFNEILCEHIDYVDIHVYIFYNFFEIYFQIKKAYAHVIKKMHFRLHGTATTLFTW
jgi:hypothetical protein